MKKTIAWFLLVSVVLTFTGVSALADSIEDEWDEELVTRIEEDEFADTEDVLPGQEEAPGEDRTPEETPAVEEETPAVEEETPAVEEEAPPVEEETPAVEEEAPPVEESAEAQGSLHNFRDVNAYRTGLFRDVAAGDWYRDNVAKAYELGLMRGTGEDVFSPGSSMTVAEAVTLAARLHSIYYTGTESFVDNYTSSGNWYDPYVDYAQRNAIVSEKEKYNYTRPVTRDAFCHILAAALPEEALGDILGRALAFADSNEIFYKADVDLLTRAGIITGVPSGGGLCFNPGNSITRAEVAAIVTRMAVPALRKG